jgi:AbrB family looped-hinge helix DNA binding protein
MSDVQVSIDSTGRIVLPKKLREELAIKPGDLFTISVHGTAVTLTPNQERAGFVRKGKALVFSARPDATLTREATDALLSEVRQERLLHVFGGIPRP